VDDPRYLKPFADKDPNLLTAYKQLPGLEAWINWSKAKQGVQAESLFIESLQNVVYGGAGRAVDDGFDRESGRGVAG
jgi:hypothetical protein